MAQFEDGKPEESLRFLFKLLFELILFFAYDYFPSFSFILHMCIDLPNAFSPVRGKYQKIDIGLPIHLLY